MCLISQSAVSGQSSRMSRFSRIMAAKKKKKKIRISNRQCHSKFPRKGSKTKYEKKNLKSDLWPG